MILKLFNIDANKIKYFSLLTFEKLTTLGFHLYFVNEISRDYYGIFTQTNYISSFTSNILLFGFAIPFLINSTQYKNNYNNEIFQYFKSISLFASFLFLSLLIIFKSFFSDLIFGDNFYFNYLIILFITIIADILSEYFILHNRIKSKLLIHSKFILFRTLIRISSLICLYILLDDFFISYLISSLCFLTYILISSKKIGFFSIKAFKNYFTLKIKINKLFIDGSKFLSLYLITTFSGLLINLILVNQFDIETFAIYSFNLTIASIPISISQYISFYSLPDFSKKFNNNNSQGNKSLLKDIFFAFSVFLLVFLIIYFSYDLIFSQFINSDYSNRPLFILIFIANALLMVNNFVQFPLLSKNKYSAILLIVSTSLILNLAYLFYMKDNITIYTPVNGLLIANSSMFTFLFIYNFILKNGK